MRSSEEAMRAVLRVPARSIQIPDVTEPEALVERDVLSDGRALLLYTWSDEGD